MNSRIIKAVLLTGLFFTIFTACKKTPADVPEIETGTVSDKDGNTYNTVKIGNQWWMAEDLRTTRYRDSSSISLIGPPPADTTWRTTTTGAYCNNLDALGHNLGRFYNYYAVSDPRGIAPKGWHIPSDEEWKQLEEYLGMSSADADNTGWRGTHEAEKLEVINGTVNGWVQYGTIWATNETKFSAMPGGCRMFDGSWGVPGQFSTEFWWTASSVTMENKAWYRYLDYKNANVFRYYGLKNYGFSIRCVKN